MHDDGPKTSVGSLSVADSVRAVAIDRDEQHFSVPSHVLSRSVGDDTVLLDLQQDEYFALGHVGTKAWALITEGRQIGTIVERLAVEYGVEPERVRADLQVLIDDLVASGLLAEG